MIDYIPTDDDLMWDAMCEKFYATASYEQGLLQGPTCGFCPIHLLYEVRDADLYLALDFGMYVDHWMYNLGMSRSAV